MSFLEVSGIFKTYKHASEPCVSNLDLSLERGEIVVLLGESGCGKSTLLKIIAGLEEADRGDVSIDGEPMGSMPPEKRPTAMVFQKALLFNNMTVEQNVNFAPRVNRTMKKAELTRKTEEMIKLVGLEGLGKKKATELSGGQEQRVSLARALMVEPKLLLLDEPLSALDATLRETMQRHIRRINRETGVTMLMVTHDQREAVAVADRIAVMHDGRIEQYDRPEAFYSRPATRYVAEFFGWRNFMPAIRNGGVAKCTLGEFALPDQVQDAHASAAAFVEENRLGVSGDEASLLLACRPEAACNFGAGRLSGRVVARECEGMSARCIVLCGRGDRKVSLQLSFPREAACEEGENVSFDLNPAYMWLVENC